MNRPPATTTPPQTTEQVRVLIVEDDAAYANLIGILLTESTELECRTETAPTLAQAQERLSNEPAIDAILLDLTLPDSQGLATLQQLLQKAPQANVIVLTGANQPAQGYSAIQLGAQDYLIKGEFEPKALGRVLRFSVQRRRILDRLEEAQQLAQLGDWEYRPAEDFFYAHPLVYQLLQLDLLPLVNSYREVEQADHPLHSLLQHALHHPDATSWQETLNLEDSTGALRYLLLTSQRESHTNGYRYRGTLQDISWQRKAELLEQKQAVAAAANRAREQVIANVSHELRTPMNAIVGLNQLLNSTHLKPEQLEYVAGIADASELLLGIINDILLASSLQKEVLNIKAAPFDLIQTTKRIMNALAPQAQAKQLAWQFKPAADLHKYYQGDKQRISQILYNLLGNAVKFTKSGSVSLQIIPSATGVCISVTDTGPGIAAEQQAEIFQPFCRLATTAGTYEGTGLGLNIARRLTEMMGGTLSVESHPGQGSCFTLLLPLSPANYEPDQTTKATIAEWPARSRLLIVEDHPVNAMVLRKLLLQHQADAHIDHASTAQEARHLLRSNTAYGLVLMDIQLPDADGYSLTTELRREKYLPQPSSLPVIALTAQAGVANDPRYRAAQFNDILLKPFATDQLYIKIAQHIHKT